MSEFAQLETAADAYRSISGWAVAALLLGLASPLAFLGPVLWVVPVLAVFACAVAVAQVGRAEQVMVGRRRALAGMALALVFGVGAATEHLANNWWLEQQAGGIAGNWFAFIQAGEPHKALQLQSPAGQRRAIDESLLDYYRQSESRKELEAFVAQPLIRTLLALGSSATVRLFETIELTHVEARDMVVQSFAVTYLEDGRKKTFFVKALSERDLDRKTKRSGWRVMQITGPMRPPSPAG